MKGGEKVADEIFVTRSSMPPYDEYAEAIRPLWESRWITNMGAYHAELEERLREYLGVDGLSLCVNGHMALELAIQAMDFPEGSEVITTPFTFISTTHAIIRNRLIPVFCDVKESDGTIDEKKIEGLITDRTAAIVPVHVYGNICAVDKIGAIARKYGLKVIYDAAHAFGERVNGEGVAACGDASAFSFHATKVFHTIEGGAVASKDNLLHQRIYSLKNFGILNEIKVAAVGANAKLNEFSAVMGLCNLRHIADAIEARRRNDSLYRELLQDVPGVRTFDIRADVDRNYAYFPILVTDDFPLTRDGLIEAMKKKGIYARRYFYPLTSDHSCTGRYSKNNTPAAADLSRRVIALPQYEDLRPEQIKRVADSIKSAEK